jgi:hypothetical protein
MLSRLAKAVTIGPLPYWASLTQWRQGGLGGFGRHAQRGHSSPMWRAATGRPVAGSATMADASLAPLFRRVQTRDEIEEAGRSPQLVQ